MNDVERIGKVAVSIFCWLVKGIGIALLLLVLTIAVGEGPPNPFKLAPRELVLMISFLITLAGTGLALWNQLIGGIAMLAGMAVFIGESAQWVFWAFAIIGALNILCWFMKRLQSKGRLNDVS